MRALLKILGFIVITFAACFTSVDVFANSYYIPDCHATIDLPDEYQVYTSMEKKPIDYDNMLVAFTYPADYSKSSSYYGNAIGQLNPTNPKDYSKPSGCIIIFRLSDIREDVWNKRDFMDLYAFVLVEAGFGSDIDEIEGTEHAMVKRGNLIWRGNAFQLGPLSDDSVSYFKETHYIFMAQDGFTPKSTNDNAMKKKNLIRHYSVLNKRKHISVDFLSFDGTLKSHDYTDSIVKTINFTEEQMNLEKVYIPLLDKDKFDSF